MDFLVREQHELWQQTLRDAQANAPLPEDLEPLLGLLARFRACQQANIGHERDRAPYSVPLVEDYQFHYARTVRPWLVRRDFSLDQTLPNPVNHPLLCDIGV